ncbi:hypothetical protein ABK040_008493 [Willaertia magna]
MEIVISNESKTTEALSSENDNNTNNIIDPLNINFEQYNKELKIKKQRKNQKSFIIEQVRKYYCQLKKDIDNYNVNNKPSQTIFLTDKGTLRTSSDENINSNNFEPYLKRSHLMSEFKRKEIPRVECQKNLHLIAQYLDVDVYDFNIVFESVLRIRRFVSADTSPQSFQQAIDSGAVPYLVNLLRKDVLDKWLKKQDRINANSLIFEVCWALTNIASGTGEQTRFVVQFGAVPLLIEWIGSECDDIKEQSIWALANIIGALECRDYVVVNFGIVGKLIEVINTPNLKISILRASVWALSNCFRGKPSQKIEYVKMAAPTFANLVYHADNDVLSDSTWGIAYSTEGSDDYIATFVEAGVCKRLVELTFSTEASICSAALRSIGNITTGDDSCVEVLLNCGVLPSLIRLLDNPKRSIKKESVWTLSNICASNVHIKAVYDVGIFTKIRSKFDEEDVSVKREILWTFGNALSGSSDQVRLDIIDSCNLCDMYQKSLTTFQADAKILGVIFETLEVLMKPIQYFRDIGEPLKEKEFLEQFRPLVEKVKFLSSSATSKYANTFLSFYEEYTPIQSIDDSNTNSNTNAKEEIGVLY